VCVTLCVCVRERERERERECVANGLVHASCRVSKRMCNSLLISVYVCDIMRKSDREKKRERKKIREGVCVCVCVCV